MNVENILRNNGGKCPKIKEGYSLQSLLKGLRESQVGEKEKPTFRHNIKDKDRNYKSFRERTDHQKGTKADLHLLWTECLPCSSNFFVETLLPNVNM